MATVNYHLKGKKNPSPIYIRVAEGKSLDLWEKTGIYVNPEFWEHKKQQIRKVLDVSNRDEINSNLKKLEVHVVDEFNKSYMTGQIINKLWLSESIKSFFNRPKEEDKLINQNRNIYFTDYAQHWLDEKAPKHKVSSSKYMDSTTIGHYQQLVDNVKKYEGRNKLLLKEVTSDWMDSFSKYLTNTEGYAYATTKRKMGRFKFFCERAEAENLEVNKNYKNTVFVAKEAVKYKQPYLNEDEINKIYKHDFSYDKTLDNVRDNLIIGLWTGLRVSDFLTRLDVSNISEDYIEITPDKTQAYGINVSIPIHWMIKEILHKRNGSLPPKISEQKFNDYIKILGQIVELDYEMVGGIAKVDEKTKKKRKVIGVYKKYLLITSHICRRSFATNLFGKVPNKTIMDVCGWKSERQFLDYNKQTSRESANVLKNYWDKKYI